MTSLLALVSKTFNSGMSGFIIIDRRHRRSIRYIGSLRLEKEEIGLLGDLDFIFD